MVPTERPIVHILPASLGPVSGPPRIARKNAHGSLSSKVRGVTEMPAQANVQAKVLLVESNSTDGRTALSQLRLGRFKVSEESTQTTEDRRQHLGEEVTGLVEVLRSEGVVIPPNFRPGVLSNTAAEERIRSGALDSNLQHSVELPAVEHLLGKRLKKGHTLAEEQLAKKVEELARSNAELEQFAYVVSHDLQEPLRMVANYTQLLAERYKGKLDVQADKYIHYAVEGALRMQALIQDLLEFSRAGGGPGNGLRNTDCKRVVEQVLKNLQVAVEESGAEVTCGNMPIVMARPLQLQQLFQNLIGNAIKFHGDVRPVIRIEATKRANLWTFSITDNGINIAPENAEIIFAIFQRLHSRHEYAGNGIGLAICKKIVEQQGGTIWVEPQALPGATFKFTWPASLRHPKEALNR